MNLLDSYSIETYEPTKRNSVNQSDTHTHTYTLFNYLTIKLKYYIQYK